jgi:formyltetrahydrofolate-dependent phosphoribosylglycinamide formyltransferase
MDFVVLSSSRGTTFQAVIDAMQSGALEARCLGLIADREDRGCIEKAKNAGLPTVIVERMKGEERESYDRRIDEAIGALVANSEDVDVLLACMGWMFIFSPWFVGQWKNRILNVHPALLPKHPGGHAIDDALAAGDAETGMTIHWIDEGVDTGKIVEQKKCSILPDDTVDTLKARVQALEKEWYPKVLQRFQTGEIRMP